MSGFKRGRKAKPLPTVCDKRMPNFKGDKKCKAEECNDCLALWRRKKEAVKVMGKIVSGALKKGARK